MRRLLAGLVGLLAITVVVLPSAAAQTTPPATTFLETFTHAPGAPAHYIPPGWDVSVIGHDDDSIEPMWANHGPNCEAPDEQWPGGQPSSATNHHITLASETTFNCNDHIMTAMNAGYGAVYLTPPALMDWSQGPATFEWDMSTERTSSRDWIDIMVLPWQDGFDPPMALNMQDFHTPRQGLQVELQGGNAFAPHVFLTGPAPGCAPQSYWKANVYYCRFSFDGFHTWEGKLAEAGLSVSAARRDHFRIEVSNSHIKVGFRVPGASSYFNWVDTDIPGGRLGWTQSVVQLNQRTYNPLKGCGAIGTGEAGHPPDGWVDQDGHTCRAGTWHIDNVRVSPSIPFTIEQGTRRVSMPGGTVTFPQALNVDGFIKAAGAWSDTEYSLDDGVTWRVAPIVGPKAPVELGDSYWIPAPAGTKTVRFRGSDPRWSIQDVYLYAKTGQGAATPVPVPPTSTPLPTVTASATPTDEPTQPPATSTPVATFTPTPAATPQPPTATPVPTMVGTPTPRTLTCALTIDANGLVTGQCV